MNPTQRRIWYSRPWQWLMWRVVEWRCRWWVLRLRITHGLTEEEADAEVEGAMRRMFWLAEYRGKPLITPRAETTREP